MTVRAVCFDLDGVLVDSFEAWFVGVNTVAAELGYEPIGREAFEAGFGQGVADDVKTFYPGADPDVIRAAYDELMPRNVAHMTLNPKALPALAWLREQGLGRAVVTNTQQTLAEQILSVHGLDSEVDTVIGVRPGLREKPAPDMIIRALDDLGTQASSAWMVGDTDYDEDAAVAANVRFCKYVMKSGASLHATLRDLVG